MADSGLLIGWKRVIPGRERAAVQMWDEMGVYFRTLHAEGLITHWEPVLLGSHGGGIGGFVLVRGESHRLDKMRNSEEFMLLNVRANKTLEDFLVVRAHFGDEAGNYLRLYASI